MMPPEDKQDSNNNNTNAAATTTASEKTPLILRAISSLGNAAADHDNDDNDAKGQATVLETILNLSKTCMGTGCLALAYACQQGGVVVYGFGLLAIAAWNVYATDRLVKCRHYLLLWQAAVVVVKRHQNHASSLHQDEEEKEEESHEFVVQQPQQSQQPQQQQPQQPPENTSTLGKVAFFAFGHAGLQVMDVCMTILLMGIVVSYLSAVISFLSDTPLTIGPLGDALVVATCMALLSLVPDLGHLSGISKTGLLVLAGTFVVIAGYGLKEFWQQGESRRDINLPMWPVSSAGLSHFFGVCVFGFGTVPLTFNFQESMKKPKLIVPATAGALTFVAVAYIALGVGLVILFPHVEGQVLHELPATGWLPTTTRLAMAVVVILTAPLLIVPAGELLEGKFCHGHKVLVRCGICLVSVFVAVLLPTFVQVLSFVGCACVGFVSFCVPPILHIRLLCMGAHHSHNGTRPSSWSSSSITMLLIDIVLLLWGMFATFLGTYLTLG